MRRNSILVSLAQGREITDGALVCSQEKASLKAAKGMKILLSVVAVMLVTAELACSAPDPAARGGKSGGGSLVDPPAGSVVTVKNVNSGLCVDTGGSSSFSVLSQANCSGTSSQNFYFEPSPTSGYYYLISTASDLCWDVSGGSSSAGALIQQYTCTAAVPEYYQVSQVSTGIYKILSGNMSNGCIDVVGGSTAPGAQIEQNTCNGSTSQEFQLPPPTSVFGYAGQGGSVGTTMSNTVSATRYQMGGQSGKVTSMSVFIASPVSAAPSNLFQVAIYADNNGTPGALLASSASQTIVPDAWNTVPITAAVAANASYWLAYNTNGLAANTNNLRYNFGGPAFAWVSPESFGTWPASFGPIGGTSTDEVSSYATFSSSSSGSLTATPSSVSFGNVSVASSASQNVTLTNTGNSDVTISNVSVTGVGFSASGVSAGEVLTPSQSATLTVVFAPTTSGSVTGSVAVASNATNSPTTIALSGAGTLSLVSVTSFGATGNGTTNDTTALKSAIAALVPGETLQFPCGTYLTTSQLFINVTNVTVDGSGCATILNTSSGSSGIMVIGGSGNGNPNYGPAVALSATANELSTSFTTVSSLGVNPGDYVLLQQGGQDSSTGSGDTGCDPSGCRGEVVKVTSVSGNTITVTTALHDTYNPSVNAATARKIIGPLTGMTVKNITFDGNGSNVYGLEIAGVGESTVSGVISKNVQGSALLNRGDFNVAWSSITVTGAGSAQCGSAAWFEAQGNLSVNGMSITNENPGAPFSGCLYNGAFGFELIQSASSTVTSLTVDATGTYGRPFKTTAARWNTFNSPTVKNSPATNNGISIEYYSSHNTYNNCAVTNNGAGTGTGTGNAGINSFGNFNQHNTFNSCTVTGNGNVQLLINNYDSLRLGADSYVTINGGTYAGTNTAEPVILLTGSNAYVTNATVNGPGAQGLYLGSTNACVNTNVFGGGTGLSAGIWSGSTTNIGSGNILNGNSSNLAFGTCTGN